jgi:hypothetical protein
VLGKGKKVLIRLNNWHDVSFDPVVDSRILACPTTHFSNSLNGHILGTQNSRLKTCCEIAEWRSLLKMKIAIS